MELGCLSVVTVIPVTGRFRLIHASCMRDQCMPNLGLQLVKHKIRQLLMFLKTLSQHRKIRILMLYRVDMVKAGAHWTYFQVLVAGKTLLYTPAVFTVGANCINKLTVEIWKANQPLS